MEKHNRKSHLAPQLSPSTKALLRSSDSPTNNSPDMSRTPTSGDIPIGGGDIRGAVISPRDQIINSINGNRSPTKNGSVGRSFSASPHPGLPPRTSTTDAVPKITTLNAPGHAAANGTSSASAATFAMANLSMRQAPPGGPLPPPPVPRKGDGDDGRKENRRQAAYGVPPSSNGSRMYGNNYSSGSNGQY